jgi:hypothetical protein
MKQLLLRSRRQLNDFPLTKRISGTILLLTKIIVQTYYYTAICESDTLASCRHGLESVGKACYLVTKHAIM